jgi:hypothetical protein
VQNNIFILLTVTCSSTIHTERIFAFLLQHRLSKCATVLCYAYIVCLFIFSLQILFLQWHIIQSVSKRTLIFNITNQPLSGCKAAPSTKKFLQTSRKLTALATLLTHSLECFDADNQSIVLETSAFSPLHLA